MTRHVYVFVAGVVTAILGAAPATAQSRFHPYAGVSIGSFSVSCDEVDGRSVAGGLFGRRVAGEVCRSRCRVRAASRHVYAIHGLSVSFAGPGRPMTRSCNGP